MITVRAETPADRDAIHPVESAAFGGTAEAELVGRLRRDGDLVLSLVAESGGNIVGHCGFSRLTVHAGDTAAPAVALAPVAVHPGWQRQGIGTAMIRQGVSQLREAGESLVIVLGEPDYYSRFGFTADAATAFRTPYDGPYLQALRLSESAPSGGVVRYPSAFAAL